MNVTVLLADKGTANLQQGTLNLLNVGWTQTPMRPAGQMIPGGYLTSAHAIAIFFEVDHQYCNRQIELVLELLTEDGQAVELPGPVGPQAMRISQHIVVQSPAGMPIGSPGVGNALIEIVPGLAVPAGGYEWQVRLAGEHQSNWGARFRVLPPPPSAPVFGNIPPVPPSPENG